MKPSIRKQSDVWVLTRPPFGFASGPVVTRHGSWKAACRALLGSAPAAAGATAERGQFTMGMTSRYGMKARRGTIRMEDT